MGRAKEAMLLEQEAELQEERDAIEADERLDAEAESLIDLQGEIKKDEEDKINIYFSFSDFNLSEKFDLDENIIYSTNLPQFMKLIKFLLQNCMEFAERDFDMGIPINFSTDRQEIFDICKKDYIPYEGEVQNFDKFINP